MVTWQWIACKKVVLSFSSAGKTKTWLHQWLSQGVPLTFFEPDVSASHLLSQEFPNWGQYSSFLKLLGCRTPVAQEDDNWGTWKGDQHTLHYSEQEMNEWRTSNRKGRTKEPRPKKRNGPSGSRNRWQSRILLINGSLSRQKHEFTALGPIGFFFSCAGHYWIFWEKRCSPSAFFLNLATAKVQEC